MTENNTALMISQAQSTLADLQKRGRGVTIAEGQTRTSLALGLSQLPGILVVADNTGSTQDDLPAIQRKVSQLLATLPETHLKIASFGDIERYDPFVWITRPTDLTGEGDGGGNRHEDSTKATAQMMQELALGMMGLPGYSPVIGVSTPLPQSHGPVSVMLITDEYPHASGVNPDALKKLDRLASYESDFNYSKISADFKNGNGKGGVDITEFVNAMREVDVPLHVYAPRIEKKTYNGYHDGRRCPSRDPLLHLGDLWSIVARATGGTYTPLGQDVEGQTIAISGLEKIKVDVERLAAPAISAVRLALPAAPSVQSM